MNYKAPPQLTHNAVAAHNIENYSNYMYYGGVAYTCSYGEDSSPIHLQRQMWLLQINCFLCTQTHTSPAEENGKYFLHPFDLKEPRNPRVIDECNKNKAQQILWETGRKLEGFGKAIVFFGSIATWLS